MSHRFRCRSRRAAVLLGVLGSGGILVIGASQGVRAVALAALAGAGLLFVATGWARRLLGVMLVGLGLALALVATESAAVVGVAAGSCVATAGVLAVLGGAGWPSAAPRYDRVAATEDPWQALDRGIDPTIEEDTPQAADPDGPA